MRLLYKCSTILIAVMLLSSCGAPKLASSWKLEGYTPQTHEKILVFAIASKTANRSTVENAMVKELNENGYTAASSLILFPDSPNVPPADKKVSKEQLAQKLKDNHIDGLLILSLLDVKEEEVYNEGQNNSAPQIQATNAYGPAVYSNQGAMYSNHYYPYYANYYNYYSNVYTAVNDPGYYQNQTTFYLQSNFYNVSDAALVWSGQSKFVDPSDVGQAAKEWSSAVVNGLKKEKIIIQGSKSK